MAEKVENLILEHLRALRTGQGRMEEELKEIKMRLSSLERGQAKGHAEYADLYGDHARQQSAIDRLSDRLATVEKRLELAEH